MSSYCHECGKKLGKDDEFCPNCGKNVKEESKKMKLKKKHIILISIIIIVIAVSVFGLPYLFNSMKTEKVISKDNQESPISESSTTTYLQSSRTSATVFIISKNEFDIAKQTGKVLPSTPEINKTNSPVDISIDVNQPIIGNNGDTFTLKVTLTNVGGGTIFDPSVVSLVSNASSRLSIPEDSLNLITIKVDTSLGAGGDTESGFCNADLKNVELRKGSTVTIPCDIKINKQITNLQAFPILLTASYGYFDGINTKSSASLIDGNSVVINFASSASEISDCDKSVTISLDVKNTGKNSIDTDTLSVCLNGKNFPGRTSEQMWAIDSSTQQCQPLKKTIIPGDTISFKWTVNSPFVPFPLTRTDGFAGRVSYNYSGKTYFIDSNEIPMNIGGIKGKDVSSCLA